jgi:hypothetical protein
VYYKFTGCFIVGTTSSTLLSDPTNWVLENPSCEGGVGARNKLCKIIATYTYTEPTKQQLLNVVKGDYDSYSFTDYRQYTVVLNGETVTITIVLKATC